MSVPVAPESLLGSWRHSHEESTPTRVVLRPDSYDFPRARGRNGLTMVAEGQAESRNPGPTDRTERHLANWHLEGNRLVIESSWLQGEFEIESVDATQLVLRRI